MLLSSQHAYPFLSVQTISVNQFIMFMRVQQ